MPAPRHTHTKSNMLTRMVTGCAPMPSTFSHPVRIQQSSCCVHASPQGADAPLELRTNVVAAYVAAGLAGELPALMSAMKLNARDSFEVHGGERGAVEGVGGDG